MELVHDLFKLSIENRAFLASRLLGPAAGRCLLDRCVERIERAFYTRTGLPNQKLPMADARKAIREYQTTTSDLAGTLELMLTYLETGTQFTREFGDINEPFYDGLSSVLHEARCLLRKPEARELYVECGPRLRELAQLAQPIGWGYGDEVGSTVAELESLFDEAGERGA